MNQSSIMNGEQLQATTDNVDEEDDVDDGSSIDNDDCRQKSIRVTRSRNTANTNVARSNSSSSREQRTNRRASIKDAITKKNSNQEISNNDDETIDQKYANVVDNKSFDILPIKPEIIVNESVSEMKHDQIGDSHTSTTKPIVSKTSSIPKSSSQIDRQVFTCRACSQPFPTSTELSDHIAEMQETTECDQCGQSFSYICSFQWHQQQHEMQMIGGNGGGIASGSNTTSTGTHRRRLKRPSSATSSTTSSDSDDEDSSDKFTTSASYSTAHHHRGEPVPAKKRRVTTNSQHVCLKCNKSFYSNFTLRRHQKVHINDGTPPAMISGKIITTPESSSSRTMTNSSASNSSIHLHPRNAHSSAPPPPPAHHPQPTIAAVPPRHPIAYAQQQTILAPPPPQQHIAYGYIQQQPPQQQQIQLSQSVGGGYVQQQQHPNVALLSATAAHSYSQSPHHQHHHQQQPMQTHHGWMITQPQAPQQQHHLVSQMPNNVVYVNRIGVSPGLQQPPPAHHPIHQQPLPPPLIPPQHHYQQQQQVVQHHQVQQHQNGLPIVDSRLSSVDPASERRSVRQQTRRIPQQSLDEQNNETASNISFNNNGDGNNTVTLPYTCHLCRKAFRTKAQLYSHRSSEHRTSSSTANASNINAKFQCTICGRNFPRLYSLQRHQKVHQKPPKDASILSGRKHSTPPAAAATATAAAHIGGGVSMMPTSGIHVRSRPDDDDEPACNDRAMSAGSSSIGEPSSLKYPCNVCGKTFPRLYSLHRHEKVHKKPTKHRRSSGDDDDDEEEEDDDDEDEGDASISGDQIELTEAESKSSQQQLMHHMVNDDNSSHALTEVCRVMFRTDED